MKYSIKEFASQIRSYYPGDYDDLSDTELVKLWLTKYPGDREKIEMSNDQTKSSESSNSFIKTIGEGAIFLIIGAVIVTGFLYIQDPERVKSKLGINTSKKINQKNKLEDDEEIYTLDSKSEIKEYKTKDIIDKSFAPYNISKYDINVLKNIYYDANPDPEGKDGLVCGSISRTCKWCSNSYNVDQKYTTYKSLIQMFTNPLGAYMMLLGSALSNNDAMRNSIHEICNNYLNGEKYMCDTESNTSEFCSLKCANDYKYK